MARIPDEALERLKREVSLTRLIEAQGLKLIVQGKDLACRCPWHEGDDTPSCIVSPKTNLWHCFGCDAGGSGGQDGRDQDVRFRRGGQGQQAVSRAKIPVMPPRQP